MDIFWNYTVKLIVINNNCFAYFLVQLLICWCALVKKAQTMTFVFSAEYEIITAPGSNVLTT